MRVGLVTACYKPVYNGVTRMVDLYRHFLVSAGHEVIVITLGKPDPAGDDPEVIRSPALPLGKSGYYLAAGYSREAQTALSKIDIVHAHHLFMGVDLLRSYAKCPIVFTNHTRYDLYMAHYTPLPTRIARTLMCRLWPRMIRLCDLVIAPTEGMRTLLQQCAVKQPVTIIPNGIDLAPFYRPACPSDKPSLGIPADAILLIFVGRLASEKNVIGLLEQFAQAVGENKQFHLLFIGSGPEEPKLRHRAQSFQLTNQIHFGGGVPFAQVSNILAAGDAFITASTSEVHPLTVIEALAAGLPVVAVQSPGISDMVFTGRNGFLAKDSDHLAEAIRQLAVHQPQLAKMGATARTESRQYDIRRTVQQTVDLYDQLLAGSIA